MVDKKTNQRKLISQTTDGLLSTCCHDMSHTVSRFCQMAAHVHIAGGQNMRHKYYEILEERRPTNRFYCFDLLIRSLSTTDCT